MKTNLISLAFSLFVALGCAHAAFVIQPGFVSTTMTMFGMYQPQNVSNKVGLSQDYTSGVTDYATYAGSGVTQATPLVDTFVQSDGATTGTWIFDFGGAYEVTNFLLWNAPTSASNRIQDFRIYLDDNVNFTSPTLVGTFTSSPSAAHPVVSESFALTSTEGRYARLEILSNAGGPRTLFGEVAFGGVMIPEPSTVLCTAAGMLCLVIRRRR